MAPDADHASLDDLIELTQDRLATALKVLKTEKQYHYMNMHELNVVGNLLSALVQQRRCELGNDDGDE